MKMFVELWTQSPHAALSVDVGSWKAELTEKGVGDAGEG
jgi:hypothetical protein